MTPTSECNNEIGMIFSDIFFQLFIFNNLHGQSV